MALFLPLGLSPAWLSRRGRVRVLAIGLLTPVLLEAGQYAAFPFSGRTCQVVDVVDDETGLLLGALLAALVVLATRLRRRRQDVTSGRPPR